VPACPSGQRCLNGRCVDQESDMGVPGPDMAGPPRDMGGGGNDGGGGGSCAATTMCPSAPGLGSVNADSGGTLSAMGHTSQWLAVETVENNSAITGQRMRLRVTLTSPASANFDLYVHRNNGGTTH
jgi:hypothetical protein